MTKIILATGNNGKIREINHLLAALPLEIVSQGSLNISSAEETGSTFVENAILKARHASLESGLPAIADDSGVVVDALNGEPGIYSARYAGVDATDSDNLDKVLKLLENRPDEERTVRFYCVMVFLTHPKDPVPFICQGVWEGRVLHSRQGEGGFGYDPIFYVPTHDCSAAELSMDEKSKISHRGQALQLLKEYLLKYK